MAEDRKTGAFDIEWDPQNPIGSLGKLYAITTEKARQQINWYKVKVKPKRFLSQGCRFLAIALLGLAALIPLLNAAGFSQRQAPTQVQMPKVLRTNNLNRLNRCDKLFAWDRRNS
jgi:hypothetical protein